MNAIITIKINDIAPEYQESVEEHFKEIVDIHSIYEVDDVEVEMKQ